MNKLIVAKSSRGSALIVAIIFLGVLTMIGVSVTLSSTSQLKIAANGEGLNDTFHATNAGSNLFISKTIINEIIVNNVDALLDNKAQLVKNKQYDIQTYGDDKSITVLTKQKARNSVCPRAITGSSVTKIVCDHFTITSAYSNGGTYDEGDQRFEDASDAEDTYNPSIVVGVYREMIQSNSATHQALDVSG